MPARHDILCGSLDFLWRPWGSDRAPGSSPLTAEPARQGRHHDAGHRTTRTCSRPAARTTTPTSADGTTCAATRATREDLARPVVDRVCPRPPPPATRWLKRQYGPHAPHLERGYNRSAPTCARGGVPRPAHDDRPPHRMLGWRGRAPPRGRFPAVRSTSSTRTSPFRTRPSRGRRYEPTVGGERIIWPPYVVGGVSSGSSRGEGPSRPSQTTGAKLPMNRRVVRPRVAPARRARHVGRHGGHRVHDTAITSATERDGRRTSGASRWCPIRNRRHMALLHPLAGRVGGGVCDALTTSVDLPRNHRRRLRVQPAHRTHGRSLAPLLRARPPRCASGPSGDVRQLGAGHRRTHESTPAHPRATTSRSACGAKPLEHDPLHVAGMAGLPSPTGVPRRPHAGSEVPVIVSRSRAGDALPVLGSGGAPSASTTCTTSPSDPDERENRVGEGPSCAMIDLLRTAACSIWRRPSSTSPAWGLAT